MKMIKLDAIDSTNSYLKKLLLKENINDFTVVVSKHQTNGRGRNGNLWVNKPSLNLAFSVYKRFINFSVNEKFMLNIVSSVSVYEVLKKYKLNNLTIKWPNDIMTENKKIAGILIENSVRGNKINHSVIGIGININQSQFLDLPNATSVFLESGKKHSVEKIAVELKDAIKKNFTNFEIRETELIEFYNSVLFKRNVTTDFTTVNAKKIQGTIIGVNKEGTLSLKQKNHKVFEYAENQIKMKI